MQYRINILAGILLLIFTLELSEGKRESLRKQQTAATDQNTTVTKTDAAEQGETKLVNEQESEHQEQNNCTCKLEKLFTKLYEYECPMDYYWILDGCYRVNYVKTPGIYIGQVPWNTARLACQAMNGDLAEIPDMKRFAAYVTTFFGAALSWIGAHRVEGEFQWLNGTVIPNDSPLWAQGEPQAIHRFHGPQDCVYMDDYGHLGADVCYKYYDRLSICKYFG